MTLQEFCRMLGWDVSELSRQAKINWRTANKALHSQEISLRAARKIAEALTRAVGRQINVGDIGDLNIKG